MKKSAQNRVIRDPSDGQDISAESMRTQWKMQYVKVEELCELILKKDKDEQEQQRMIELAKQLLF